MTNAIVYCNDLKAVLRSAINTSDRDIVGKTSGLYSVSRMLSMTGAMCRSDDKFAHNFSYTPIPDDFITPMNFGEVSIDSANQLWSRSKNEDRKIALFWSGGIDSTVALVSLIQTNPNWCKDLIVYTSDYAVTVEYPLFFNTFIKDKVKTVFLSGKDFFNPELINDKVIVVDGTCGDQLWGCNVLQKIIDKAHTPYKSLYTNPVFLDLFIHKNQPAIKSKTIEYIENLVSNFPVETKTIANLYWMLTFTHKWDIVRLRHSSFIQDINKFGGINSFFNTENFQRWTMTNPDLRLQRDWKTYKQPAKDFIYQFTGDDDYRINKLQHESMGKSIHDGSNFCYTSLVTINGYKLLKDMQTQSYIELLNTCLK